MPVYTFTGKNKAGAKVTGERTAESKMVLTQMLRKEQITPAVINEKGKEFAVPKSPKGKVATKDLARSFEK